MSGYMHRAEYEARLIEMIDLMGEDLEATTEAMRSLGIAAEEATCAVEEFGRVAREGDWSG